MKNQSLLAALKAANLQKELRVVLAAMPALEGVVEAFYSYITLLPPALDTGHGGEPLVIACLRDAIEAVVVPGRPVVLSPDNERRFILALFAKSPQLLDTTVWYEDVDDADGSCCWTPFDESVGEFVARFPSAGIMTEPCPIRETLSDAIAREMITLRILPASWARIFVESRATAESCATA